MAEVTTNDRADRWIRFLRRYGPVPKNDNMYDEAIQRSAKRAGVTPIVFEHPRHDDVLFCFDGSREPVSVILTGTAGDGKTHLCRQVWEALDGDKSAWHEDNPYLMLSHTYSDGRKVTLHFIRDLSAWAPQRGMAWDPHKQILMQTFSESLFEDHPDHLFLLAANDGQLVESWRRLESTEAVSKTRDVLETLLVENRSSQPDVALRLFNMSRGSSAALFGRALEAFLEHEGWEACYALNAGADQFFGPDCPIRYNYELLKNPLVQRRLRALLELCDYNQLHIPIRQILLLLANAVLGHPDVRDRLMVPKDVPEICRANTRAKASLYNNIFGGNLTDTRRQTILIFDYLEQFRIGHETSNRIDNILIFGERDSHLSRYFKKLLAEDIFYGADTLYRTAQREYIEGDDESEKISADFLEQLVEKRRGLFFKIPIEQEEELKLWELTVFRYAGEYLEHVINTLTNGGRVKRSILARLVKGLNRIFTGMLVSSDRELFLAKGIHSSQAKVSRILEERISVRPRPGERVEIVLQNGIPTLHIMLSDELHCSLPLHLTRFEFLSRVGEGALPSSFSKECYEDILAFKSQLLSAVVERNAVYLPDPDAFAFRILELDEYGNPREREVEFFNA